MHILRSADYKCMPWKNGKGKTVEIAVFPPDASVSDFDWRISMATVASDGPFSTFDEVDRTLSVLTGEGIELTVAGNTPVICHQSSTPYTFPADVPSAAVLLVGPISDLNVMTRRGRYGHRVRRVTFEGEGRIGSDLAMMFVISTSPLEVNGLGTQLEPLDAV